MDSLDPAFLDDDEMRTALAARDIGVLYRRLRRLGVNQRRMGHGGSGLLLVMQRLNPGTAWGAAVPLPVPHSATVTLAKALGHG